MQAFHGQILEVDKREKLDLTDRKIIYLLGLNARYSDTALAKALKIKREVVAYRIKRMQEKGILHGFLTLIDETKLGSYLSKVFIKLRSLSSAAEIIAFLQTYPDAQRIADCSGAYDLHISFISKSLKEFDDLFETLLSRYTHAIQDYMILSCVEDRFTGVALLLSEEERKGLRCDERKGSTFQQDFLETEEAYGVVAVDDKDKQILTALRLDAKQPLAQLGKEVRLSQPSVESRVRRLIRAGVIRAFMPYASLSHLGYHWYALWFQTKNLDKRTFLTYLQEHSNVTWYNKTIGRWNYQVMLYAHDNAEFNRILNNIRTRFADNIIAYDSLIMLNQHQFVPRID